MSVKCTIALVITGFALVSASASSAQTGGAPVLSMDPSVRASGMGRTSVAVFWGGDPNDWANPALLGYSRGVRFTHGKTRLVPDLVDGVFLKSDRTTIGLPGLGFSLSGRPDWGTGRTRLNYGTSIARTEDGIEIGRFESYENLYSFGAGASLAALIENLVARWIRAPHPFSRYADFSYGYTSNRVDVNIAPPWATPEGIDLRSTVRTADRGWLVRVTPVNTVTGPGLTRSFREAMKPLGGFQLDVAYGHSTHNRGKTWILIADADLADPIARIGRSGWAVHAALGLPPSVRQGLADRRLEFLADCLSPIVELGVSWERSHLEWPSWRRKDIKTGGAEITVANIVSIRGGRIVDRQGDIVGETWGFGIGLPVGNYGGFRYDRAVVPQARGLGHVARNGFTAFVSPLAFFGGE